ncbi:hypothetical protein [Nodosilinea sp. P-1105]|uniref:hypothetical protein n=1 Tax=Nodosilinea sp. P-1105 TaxID=2546229 RepID=UPI00146F1FBE|nr:hypothetical protein [Nodosilinea sp. P-1105]NMF84813.1 hypothetical protein [Nodosilinea sp. P-1105]
MTSVTINAFNHGSGPGIRPTAQPLWLRETVQTFFAGVAWSGAASPSHRPRTTDQTSSEATLAMTVDAFFGTVPWDGQPEIGVPIAPLAAPSAQAIPAPEEDDLTLDGFSDLFG